MTKHLSTEEQNINSLDPVSYIYIRHFLITFGKCKEEEKEEKEKEERNRKEIEIFFFPSDFKE